MPNLEELFQETFEDGVFSRAERRALAKILLESDLTEQERGALRAKIFDFAQEKVTAHAQKMAIKWLYDANKLLFPQNQQSGFSHQVYFSPGDDCLHAIQQHLRQAKRRVDICVFTISDDRITREILACHHRGVPIRLLTDNDKMEDRGSDIYQLGSAGVPVRIDTTPHHMHHKFALVDEQHILTGSYNWTRSAAVHNEENILVSNDPAIIQAYVKQFNRMWPEMEPLS